MWIEFNKSYPRAWEKLPKQNEEGIHTVRAGTGEDAESPANTPSCPAPAPAKGRIPPWVLASCPVPQWWPDYPEGLWSAPFMFQEATVGETVPFQWMKSLWLQQTQEGPLSSWRAPAALALPPRCADGNFSCLVIWLRFECFNCQCVRQTVRSANRLI